MEALVVAFGAGPWPAASPCLLPLYPAFLAYLTGSLTGTSRRGRSAPRLRLPGPGGPARPAHPMMLIGLARLRRPDRAAWGSVLAFAMPFIDVLLIVLGVMLLAGVNPFLRIRPRSACPAPTGRSRRPTSTACSWAPSRCPVPARSWWRCWRSRWVPRVGRAPSPRSSSSASASACRWCCCRVLARARQDTVVRFLARHHRQIEIISGVLLIGAGIWDLWINWDSILLDLRLLRPARPARPPGHWATARGRAPAAARASWAMSLV